MSEQLSEDVLREKGLAVLDRELGPVQAFRFLAIISRQPFDYERWRQGHFEGLSLSDILSRSRTVQHDRGT
jgi:hypothetical protein